MSTGGPGELARANAALRESEARYRAISELTSDYLYSTVVDDDGGETVDWVTDAFTRITGYTVLEAVRDFRRGLHWPIANPDDRARLEDDTRSRLRRGLASTIDLRIQTKAGEHRYLRLHRKPLWDEARGRVVRIFGAASDVTKQREAEVALRESEERYRSLFETALDAVMVVDSAGRFIDLNPRACAITGFSRDELIGATTFDLTPVEEQHRIETGFAELVEHGARQGEFRLRRKDGFVVDVEYSSARVSPDRFQSILRDVTERKRSARALEEALRELKATQQQVIQQERLRALGQIASGIAHDFNNSLAQIQGYIELLLKVCPQDLSDAEKVRRYLEWMEVAAEDAASTVRRLREFYRPRSDGEVFLFTDLNRVVEQAVSLTQPAWKNQAMAQGIAIEVVADLAELPPIESNEAELREALTNLIFNSVAAIPERGTVTIRTRLRDGAVLLEVADDGTGMTEEVRRRCFEPFFTTKGPKGTGLGLAMVYGIVQRHRGTIEVSSEVGVGTNVRLTFPLARPNRTTPRPDGREPRPVSPLQVLVVDDEPRVRQVLTELLLADGHYVEGAANGRDGLQRFLSGRFDLVITDRAMPEMSGDDLAIAIKRRVPNKPVLLVTGFGDALSGEKDAGAVDMVLPKPVTLDALRQAIATLVMPAAPVVVPPAL